MTVFIKEQSLLGSISEINFLIWQLNHRKRALFKELNFCVDPQRNLQHFEINIITAVENSQDAVLPVFTPKNDSNA